MSIVFDGGCVGRRIAAWLVGGGAFVPAHTLFALGGSCARGRRHLQALLAFALEHRGVRGKVPKADELRARFLGVRVGRLPWVSKSPVVPPWPDFHVHCCANDGGRLLAFAGLGTDPVTRGCTLQVSLPKGLPLFRGDRRERAKGYVTTPFSVGGARIGWVEAMRWSQSSTQTLLVLSVDVPHRGMHLVVFRVGQGGLLTLQRIALFDPGDRLARVCDVPGADGDPACHVVFSGAAISFWAKGVEARACTLQGLLGQAAIQCLNAVPFEGGVYAVSKTAAYHIRLKPRGGLRVSVLARLQPGFAFVGPMCVTGEGGGLVLLCMAPGLDQLELVRVVRGFRGACTVCHFEADQDYRAIDDMGVFESGAVVLCGGEGHRVFSPDCQGGYAQPEPVPGAFPCPIAQTRLVIEGGWVRALLSLHGNGLVSVWGAHPSVAAFRPASMPR